MNRHGFWGTVKFEIHGSKLEVGGLLCEGQIVNVLGYAGRMLSSSTAEPRWVSVNVAWDNPPGTRVAVFQPDFIYQKKAGGFGHWNGFLTPALEACSSFRPIGLSFCKFLWKRWCVYVWRFSLFKIVYFSGTNWKSDILLCEFVRLLFVNRKRDAVIKLVQGRYIFTFIKCYHSL